jgi:dienelactone hydrolase
MPALYTLLVLIAMQAGPANRPAAQRPDVKVTNVTLKGTDGVALTATYYTAGKPGPGIMLLHQCNADRKTWTKFATDAAARGYNLLALDFRGFGESQGQRAENLQEQQAIVDGKWPGDVDAAFAWLTSQPGVDGKRIGAAGASCGVNQSVQLARRHPEEKTVVLLSGPVNAAGRDYLNKSAWLPVLGAASHGDGRAVDEMRWVMGWSRNPSNRFLEYKAAGHGTEMFAVEKGLEPAILDWFDKNLRNAQTTPPATAAASKPTIVEEFWTAMRKPDVAAARKIYDDTRKRSPKPVLFPETEMNLYGYQVLQQENRPKDAIVIFQMNVDAYPQSANVYDSLSDAYLAAGDKVLALKNAEKALQMLATDKEIPQQLRDAVRQSAEQKIRDLKKT